MLKRRDFLKFAAGSALLGVLPKEAEANSDVYLQIDEMACFEKIYSKLKSIQRVIGYGNFNIISFDEALKIAKRYKSIEAFSRDEIALMEKIFYMDATKLGFYGARTVDHITYNINKKEALKIKGTGHWLFKGKPKEDYERILKDVGHSLKLTSGIRSVIKQTYLYYGKVKKLKGNLSKASFSIAPPAYSYHTIRDFDVGRVDWGYSNFTARFALTKEFHRLRHLDYISMRYGLHNRYGVRFEPWHIKVLV